MSTDPVEDTRVEIVALKDLATRMSGLYGALYFERDALRREIAGLDVERLREAARNVGMPHDVTVADIENLATEYARLAARDEAP